MKKSTVHCVRSVNWRLFKSGKLLWGSVKIIQVLLVRVSRYDCHTLRRGREIFAITKFTLKRYKSIMTRPNTKKGRGLLSGAEPMRSEQQMIVGLDRTISDETWLLPVQTLLAIGHCFRIRTFTNQVEACCRCLANDVLNGEIFSDEAILDWQLRTILSSFSNCKPHLNENWSKGTKSSNEVAGTQYCWAYRQSFVCSRLHADEACMSQNNGKWPLGLVYVSIPLITVGAAIWVLYNENWRLVGLVSFQERHIFFSFAYSNEC